MHHHEQQVFRCIEPQHARAQDRPGAEIERKRGLVFYKFRRSTCACIHLRLTEVYNPKLDLYFTGNDLPQATVYAREMSAQRIVTRDYFVEATVQNIEIQATPYSNRARHVISDALRIELMKKPQPLLGKRCARGFANR